MSRWLRLQEEDLGEIERRCIRALSEVELGTSTWELVNHDIPALLRVLRVAYSEMADMKKEIERLQSSPPPPAPAREAGA